MLGKAIDECAHFSLELTFLIFLNFHKPLPFDPAWPLRRMSRGAGDHGPRCHADALPPQDPCLPPVFLKCGTAPPSL